MESAPKEEKVEGERDVDSYMEEIIRASREARFSFEHEQEVDTKVRELERDVDELSKYEITLIRLLKRYGVEDVSLRKEGDDVFSLVVPENIKQLLPELPEGYGYAGGAARSALMCTLGKDRELDIRDYDIVRNKVDGDSEVDRELSEKFMYDDYVHGYGVSSLGADYFSSRDFTFNEIYFDGERLWCTKDCLLDSARGIIRLSQKNTSETSEDEQGEEVSVNDKLLAKALRFVARSAIQKGEDAAYVFANLDILKYHNIAPFHMALHLDRAFGEGRSVAEQYLQELRANEQLPEEVDSVEKLLEYLHHRLYSDFVYKHAPHFDTLRKEREAVDAEIENMYRIFEDKPLQGTERRFGRNI